MACLDTTILIDLLSRKPGPRNQAGKKIKELTTHGEELAITRFNLAELYVGIARSHHPQDDEEAMLTCLGELETLDFNDDAAKLFGSITGFLQRMGKPAADMDILIAATAMAHNHMLITRNIKHFKDIPDLIVEAY